MRGAVNGHSEGNVHQDLPMRDQQGLEAVCVYVKVNGVDDFRGCLKGGKVKTVPWAVLAALKGKGGRGGRGGRGDGGQRSKEGQRGGWGSRCKATRKARKEHFRKEVCLERLSK